MTDTTKNNLLDPEWKDAWLEALCSGNYEQGIGQLRSASDRFCCLGVLCDVAAKKGHGEWAGGVNFVNDFPFLSRTEEFGEEEDSSVLPRMLQGLLGVDSDPSVLARLDEDERIVEVRPDDDSGVPEDGHWAILGMADLNDTYGLSFAEIADIIEKTL